jgi:hypothetical protein
VYAMRNVLRYAAGALLVGLLAACSSGGSAGSSGTPTPTAMTDDEILAIGREAAQCIREHGVPNFPDPAVSAGQLTLPGNNEPPPEADAALAACRSILDRLPPSALGEDEQAPGPEDVPQLLRFAQCIRENGIPDWPDPKADGSFPIMDTPLAREGKSSRMQRATQACQQYWDGGIRAS